MTGELSEEKIKIKDYLESEIDTNLTLFLEVL